MVWLAVANSFTMDFIARKKIALTMSYTVLDSLPFPRVDANSPIARCLVPIALLLTCTDNEMSGYWNSLAALGFCDPVEDGACPPGLTDESDRLSALCEIEAIVARTVFGLSKDELTLVLGTFPIVREKEEKKYGEYRTQHLVLEAFDKLADSPRFRDEMPNRVSAFEVPKRKSTAAN